jgi:hypothetical protein
MGKGMFTMDSSPDQRTAWLSYYQPNDARPPIPPCSVPSPDMPRLNSPNANACTLRSSFSHGEYSLADAPGGSPTNMESQLPDDFYIDIPLEDTVTAREAHKVRVFRRKIRNHSRTSSFTMFLTKCLPCIPSIPFSHINHQGSKRSLPCPQCFFSPKHSKTKKNPRHAPKIDATQ